MRYLKSFKRYSINENNMYDVYDLSIDEERMDEYYEKNYSVDEDNYRYMGSQLFQFVDDDAYMEEVKDDEKNNNGVIEYWDEDEFIEYVEETDTKSLREGVDKIIKDKKYDVDDDMDFHDKLELLKVEDFHLLITDYDDEYDFVNFVVDKRYDDKSLEDYLSEFTNSEGYYDYLKGYIDHEKLEEWYKENESPDHKREYYLSDLADDGALAEEIFNYANSNALILFELIEDNDSYIAKTEDFQDAYINELKKRDVEDFDTEEEWAKEEMPGILLELEKKFGLNEKIRKKYGKYGSKVSARQFNL